MNLLGIFTALKRVLSKTNYFLLFLILTAVILAIYLLLPVYTTHENLNTYLISTTPSELFLTAFLSVGLSALVVLQVFVWLNIGKTKIKESAGGLAAFISSLISGIAATASCGLCLSALFSLIGSGGFFFLSGHRLEILLASLLLLLISLYYTAKRININPNGAVDCEDCSIKLYFF